MQRNLSSRSVDSDPQASERILQRQSSNGGGVGMMETSTKQIEENTPEVNTSTTQRQGRLDAVAKEIMALRFTQSITWIFLACFFLLLPFFLCLLVGGLLLPWFGNPACVGCELDLIQCFVPTAWVTLVSVPLIYILRHRRGDPDPLGIVKEGIVLANVTGIWGYISIACILLDPNGIMYQTRQFNWHYIATPAIFLGHFITCPLQVYLAKRERNERTNSNNAQHLVELENILNGSQDELESFSEYLKSEFSYENLKFLLEGRDFKVRYPLLSPEDEMEQVNYLYHAFIRAGSLMEINLSSRNRARIAELVHAQRKNKTPAPADIFDEAMQEISIMLSLDCLQRYLRFKREKTALIVSAAASP
jgi:hypothetical protein